MKSTMLKFNIFLGFNLLLSFASNISAKTCTASTIIQALNSKGRFVFSQENCSNTTISTNRPIKIGSNKIIDGSGKLIMKWSGGHGCDEKPSQDTIFDMDGNSSVIKNLTMDWSPEGIHMNGDRNTVDNVTYKKICEDGLTNYGNNNVVKNSLFQNAPDKCIQTNGGSATFINNTFKNCPRSIGSCSDKADPGNHPVANCRVASFNTVISNKFYGPCEGYAIRASGKKSKNANGWLKASNNDFYNCSAGAMQVEEDGILYSRNNRIHGGVAFDYDLKSKSYDGEIYECNTKLNDGAKESKDSERPIEDCRWE